MSSRNSQDSFGTHGLQSASSPSEIPSPLTQSKSRRKRYLLDSTSRIKQLSSESRQCLYRLASYRPPKLAVQVPRSRRAAVLVALFVGRNGDLYVLLSRRSATLRTYAGDTSLPGGKVDPEDRNIEETAVRIRFMHRIGLPRDHRKVPLLCVLEPFLAAELVVTPVVVLILDNTLRVGRNYFTLFHFDTHLQPILNTDEVASLFSHPLVSFLTTTSPYHASEPETVEVPYHQSFSAEWSAPHGKKYPFLVHQFLTGREAGGIKPIFGLTAGMMIRVATIGYGREPEFQVIAPGTPSLDERVAWALLNRPVFRRACEKEGVSLALPMKICGIVRTEFETMKKEQDGGNDSNEKDGKKSQGEIAKRRNWLRVWRAKL
ncbi:Nudix hydrolase 15, mitochondrial [Leucoagaricus sp. SymC.cos]|nr:Nudix hydrolase 15, mitochondrial [Leucoagaricus sp. SymC.cos]